MSDERDRVHEIFAARLALLDGAPRTPLVGVGDLVRFLDGRRAPFSAEEMRTLFASPPLLATWRALKQRTAVLALPQVAAASDGEVALREFPGGTLELVDSQVEGEVYLKLRLDPPFRTAHLLALKHRVTGEEADLPLDPADETGEVFMLLGEAEAGPVRLLRDVDTDGTFHAPGGVSRGPGET